jgi:hypothetical protein
MSLVERCGIVPVLQPADYAAGGTGDSFTTKYTKMVTFIVQCGTLTDNGGAGADLTIKSGAAAATQTTAETFYYRTGSAANGSATADVYGARTSAATLELLKANFDSKTILIEVPVDEITVDQPWLTLAVNNHGTAANLSCVAILEDHAYKQYQVPTSIT